MKNKSTSRIVLVTLAVLAFSITPIYYASGDQIQITKIIDGDTFKLGTGEDVRLLQIDTPEMRGSECYAQEARVALAKILRQEGKLVLQRDSNLNNVDSFGRLLRYAYVGGINVNLSMVQVGAATPYFFKRQHGRYSKQLLSAAQKAKEKEIGLWKACPGTKLDPYKPLTTVYGESNVISSKNRRNCDSNYQGCIPVFPPDLDCIDIKKKGLAPVRIVGRDVHRLDHDGNGIGCE